MENKGLQDLRGESFEIKIDPSNPYHAANAEDVVKVISACIASYKAFLKINLREELDDDETIKEIVDSTQLLVVDNKFSSYASRLAPYNPSSNPIPLFTKYKEEIINSDINNWSDVMALRQRYNKEELRAIYAPLFKTVNGDFKLVVEADGKKKIIQKPKKEFETYFKPSVKKEDTKPSNKLFQVFVESEDLSKISSKNILYSEELQHETYPYTLSHFVYDGNAFILNNEIVCDVKFEEEMFFISYQDLNINVWGDTRKDAEEAFHFMFYSIWLNYAKEDDANLTDDAIVLKDKVNTMIAAVR